MNKTEKKVDAVKSKSKPADDLIYMEQIVKEVREDYNKRRENRSEQEQKWQLSMNFIAGNQYAKVGADGRIDTAEKDYYWQERLAFNHLAPILETRLAKLARLSPSMSVLPATDDDTDLNSAKLSTKLLKSVSRKIKLDALIRSANCWSEALGTVFYKVTWNANLGKIVVGGKEVAAGDVEITVCSPFEIYPDNLCADGIGSLRSLIHAKAYHIDDIRGIYGVTVKADSEAVTHTVNGSNHTLENHAVVIERYEAPNTDYPEGRLTIIAGDKLLYIGELPYINGEDGARAIPFAMQASVSLPGSFFGTSVIERSIPIQRAYNAVKNRKHEFLNRLSSGVLAVEDGSVDTDELAEDGLMPGKILVYRQGSAPPGYLNPGSLPNDFTYEEDRLMSEFVSVSGVSEIMRSSQTPTTVSSGIALQLLIEQDDTRLSVTADSCKAAVKECAKQILRLYRQFVSTKRIERIVGENGDVELMYFNASDLTSDDVIFVTDNEISETPAQKKNFVFELLRAGLLFDEGGKMSNRMRLKVLEILGFGAWENSLDIDTLQQHRAQSENLTKTFKVSDIDDHEMHVREHIKYMLGSEFEREAAADKKLSDRLHTHLSEHRLVLESAAAALRTAEE